MVGPKFLGVFIELVWKFGMIKLIEAICVGGDLMPDINWIKEKIVPIAIRYGLNKMYLFGSYAKGTATEESDIDLLFERGDKITLLGVSSMLLDLKESLGKSVDLVSVNSLEPSFAKEVYGSEVLLYEK